MCEPVTASIMIGSALYGLHNQRRNANRMERQMREAHEAQSKEIRQSAGVEADDRARRARAERGRLRAMQAESGVAGITMDTLLRDRDVAAGRDIGRIGLNQENRLEASARGLQSNFNQIQQPDYLGTALNAGLQLYGAGMTQGTIGQSSGPTISGSGGGSNGIGPTI